MVAVQPRGSEKNFTFRPLFTYAIKNISSAYLILVFLSRSRQTNACIDEVVSEVLY